MRLENQASTEFRYQLIVKLHLEGNSQTSIAKLVNCSQAWVSKILKRYKTDGEKAFRVKGIPPGKKSKLSQDQLRTLGQLLLQGAIDHGFETDNWTRVRVAQVIEQHFGVRYSAAHISRIMKKIGFSSQKPQSRSYRKDEQQARIWKNETLPQIKKKQLKVGICYYSQMNPA